MISFPGLWVVSLILSFWSSGGYAQFDQVRFDRFTDDEGLPNNLYKQAIQDKDGLIWMGGSNGLARFDGHSVQPYYYDKYDSTSISGNNISRLYEDRDGRLWLGVIGSGINVSDPLKRVYKKVRLPDEIQNAPVLTVNEFTQDSSGRIWLATNAGILLIREVEGAFDCRPFQAHFPTFFSEALRKTDALYTDPEGHVWIGTQSGLYRFGPGEDQWLEPRHFPSLPARWIDDINLDREGRIWIGLEEEGPRLYFAEKGTRLFSPMSGIPFNDPHRSFKFTFDLDNRLWASCFGDQVYGYDFRDSSLFLRTTVNSNISHERFFRTPLVDRTGAVWVPCEGFYIHRYPKGFRSYLHPYGFHQSNTCIYGTGPYMWVAYREKGMVRLDTRKNETILFSADAEPGRRIPVNHIADLLKVKSGNMIVVGFNNIAVMDPAGKIIRSFGLRGTNRVVYEDRAGRIWIGGYDGLHLFSEAQGVIRTDTLPASFGDDRNYIQAILEDSKGNIWLASDLKGLARLNPETHELQQFQPTSGDTVGIPSVSVIDMDMDRSSRIWLATDVALACFDLATHTITTYNRSDGIASDYITAVLCADDGLIWVSTHAGISSFDPMKKQFTNYSRGDGLLNTGYYTRSKYRSPEGIMYFGGKNGVDYFHPSWLRKNPVPPQMFFTEIRVNHHENRLADDELKRSGVLTLTHKDNLLEFEVSGMHFSGQDEVRYFYKMDGLHEEWIDLGEQRNILISGLKAGEYTFRAKAISGDGVWSANELTLPIVIQPPFYGTIWFRLLGISALLTALLSIIKIREHSIKRNERQEAAVNRKIAELEKRALQAQMNPHFIYNSMNSIQQFMIVHDVEGAMKYLTRFSRILRTVLNMSAQNRIPLYDEVKLIEDYLELENMRFPNKFSYDIRLDPDINIHTVEIPPFFIQPQVENAIRHGLLKKITPGHLQIDIRMDGPDLRIIVEDNGIGREASQRLKRQDSRIVESKGLAIMEERLSHVHVAEGHIPFKITDLYDAAHRPAGTKVEIVLPLD